jgi:hypothetical protein
VVVVHLQTIFMTTTKKKTTAKEDKDPCWKDYEQAGTKKKDGKTVPNCIPKNNEAKKK